MRIILKNENFIDYVYSWQINKILCIIIDLIQILKSKDKQCITKDFTVYLLNPIVLINAKLWMLESYQFQVLIL